MGAVDEAFKSVMPPHANAMMQERGSPAGWRDRGCRRNRLKKFRVYVYKILKVELECVRHCDRIWIMVV